MGGSDISTLNKNTTVLFLQQLSAKTIFFGIKTTWAFWHLIEYLKNACNPNQTEIEIYGT